MRKQTEDPRNNEIRHTRDTDLSIDGGNHHGW